MKRINYFFLVLCAVAVFFSYSCKNELLPMPDSATTTEGTTAFLGDVSAPQNLSVTNGQKQKITITWSADANATRYNIYTAATPFDTFIKIAETTDAEYVYNAVAGVTRYFKVSAVNYKDVESDCSKIVSGTTLACPILSDVQSTEEDGIFSTKIFWYMENVNSYQDLVRYTVHCYLDGDIVQSGVVDGSETTETAYEFSDLNQATEYQYQVEAYLVSAQDEVEVSALMNAQTIISMRPKAVENLVASEGSEPNTITLKFNLPEKSFVSIKNSFGVSYEEYPLYFKIYRRIAGTEDWGEREAHLYWDGTNTGYGELTGTDEEKLAQQTEYFDGYEVGKEITWVDEHVARGVQYEYKIQSYIDNYEREMTNESSIATATGWAYPEPVFKKPALSYGFNADKTAKTSATITYSASWDNLGGEENYKYVVETNWSYGGASSSDRKLFSTIGEVAGYAIPLNLGVSDRIWGMGNYSFKFYIVSGEVSSADVSNPFITVELQNGLMVSADVNEPAFSGVGVKSGYVDKVVVEWEVEADLSYVLERVSLDGSSERKSYSFPSSEPKFVAGNTFQFEDTTGIESGKSYEYVLKATRDSTGSMYYCNDYLVGKTLGIPDAKFRTDKVSYNSFTLEWAQVQQAEYYTITFGGTPIVTNILPSKADAEGNIIYPVDPPAGYNGAGIKNKAQVIAYSNVDNTESISPSFDAYTLGPILTTPKATVAENTDRIVVTWKKVKGAEGYAVRRDRCSVKAPYEVESTDVYYINSKGDVTVAGEPCSAVDLDDNNEQYTFID